MDRGRLLTRAPVTPPTRRLAFIPEPVEPERSGVPAAPTTPRCWRTAPPPPPPGDAAGRTPMSERQQLALLLQMTSPAAPSTPSSGEASPTTATGGATTTAAQRRLHKRNERGETPLQVAAIRGDLRRVRRLIADGADVNAADFAGWTPLHEACIHGWSSVARALLAAGADVNRPGLDRVTPLHDAAGNSRRRLVRLLLRHGADPAARTARGQPPAELASEPRVRALLETAAAGAADPAAAADTDSSDDTEDEEDKENQPSTPQRRPTRLTSRLCRLTAAMDAADTAAAGDMYDFKPEQEGEPSAAAADKDEKKESKQPGSPPRADDSRAEDNKRPASEMEDADTEESGKKKKKKEDAPKPAAKTGKGGEKAGKTAGKTVTGGKTGKGYGSGNERRSPTGSQGAATPPKSKPTSRTTSDDSDGEERREGPKVPPLKIVINAASAEQEQVKGGKGTAGARLPYVVASQAEAEPDEAATETPAAQTVSAVADTVTEAGSPGGDKSSTPARVTRSQRALQGGSGDAASPESAGGGSSGGGGGGSAAADTDRPAEEEPAEPPAPPPPPPPAPPVVEHPRKRKIRQARATQQAAEEEAAAAAAGSPAAPADPPFMNNYKAFQEIRRQIDRRRRELFPITPKPPRGFKDYLINRATYVLAGNVHSRLSVPTMAPPCSLAPGMKDLFVEQEIERYKLRLQHIIEKEKLVLTVEQEILRVHGRAARALANQALPFSACTILRDEEVYNLATPEQEEKDRNVRDRYNGRQFFSWLQDVDDKWEKIKEGMVLRHHNEAESLHAVQKMDWEWKLKEIGACDPRTTPNIDELHVPMVKVIDDFDMPPS